MIDLKTYDNIAKYLSGNMNPEEQDQFMRWLENDPANRKLLEEMARVWSTESIEKEADFDNEAAWEKISGEITQKPVEMPVKHLNPVGWMQLLKIAAVFILCMAVSIWFFYPKEPVPAIQFVESDNVSQIHVLPDGSTISLNKNTRISYDKNFEKRFVTLAGEAFFEVKPDKQRSFVIHTEKTRTEVLGTAFNLRAYPGEAREELLVAHGKVAFSSLEKAEKQDAVILTKGESGLFEKATRLVYEKQDTSQNAFAWRTGKLEFHESPAHEVVKALERYYQIKFEFEFPENSNCPATFVFENETLDDALVMLEFTLRTAIKKKADHYLITGKACIEKMKE